MVIAVVMSMSMDNSGGDCVGGSDYGSVRYLCGVGSGGYGLWRRLCVW